MLSFQRPTGKRVSTSICQLLLAVYHSSDEERRVADVLKCPPDAFDLNEESLQFVHGIFHEIGPIPVVQNRGL